MLTRRSIDRRPYIAKSHEILGHKRTNDRWGFRLRPVDVRAQGRRRIASWCRGSDANQRSHERAHSYQRFASVTLIVRPRKIGRAHAELQSLMRISYAVFCLKKKNNKQN